MSSLPRYECYVADHVCCVLYLSDFCTIQHNKHQTAPKFYVCHHRDTIRRVENGEKRSTVADKLKIHQDMLSTLLRNESDINKKALEKAHSTSQRVRLLPGYDNGST